MKSKRVIFSEKILSIIKFLLKRLSFFFAQGKGKFVYKKAKIRAKEIEERTKRKERIESEVSPKIQPQEKREEKKEVKEEVLEKREKEIEKTEETSKETQIIEMEERVKGEPSEKKIKEEEGTEEPIEEILEELETEQEPKEEKKEEKTPKGTKRKPYIKKTPTEESKKKQERLPPTERKILPEKKKEAIDLGNASKRKYKRMIKSTQDDKEIIEEKKEGKPEEKVVPIRIESPFVDINLDESRVSLVLPRQQFELDNLEEVPKQIKYKIEINGEGRIEIPVKVKNLNQNVAQAQEKRIFLEKPLESFKILFPKEFQGRTYIYNHRKKNLYVFIAIGNNRGRLHYLYDNDGKLNDILKRDVWILLHEDFELKTEEVIVEENKWMWDKYRPFLVNLKKINNLEIENKKTGNKEKLPCCNSFFIEGEQLIEDDFEEESPLILGNTLKIKAPKENPSGWCLWIQSKETGSKIVTENWSGAEELHLILPDCLPCEYGEFQVDVCQRNVSIPDETLFFRWIDFIGLKYPKNLIIPNHDQGNKVEHVEIKLKKLEDWDLKCRENLKPKIGDDNICRFDVPPETDVVHLSIAKKGNPGNELNLKITIPRLKWKTSKESFWRDRIHKIKRESLDLDGYLIIRTNDLKNKYDLIATLEANGKQLQEARFIRKGIDYLMDLKRFYDTIKGNKEDLKLKAKIMKDSQLLSTVEVLDFKKEVPPIKKRVKQKIKSKRRSKKGHKAVKILAFVKCRNGMRKGKGFSEKEIIEAEINFDDLNRINITYDRRRKSYHQINITTLKKLKRGN